MADKTGWIKLHRQIAECWVWDDKPYSKGQAWIDLILLANYKDQKTAYKDEVKSFQRGTTNLSQKELAERWGWDRRKVKRFLTLLENDNMINQESTTQGTIITLINYEKYNDTDSKTDKKPQKETVESIIEDRNLSEGVESIIKEWVKYKSERRETYKPQGLKSFITEVQNNVDKYGEEAVGKVVRKSMSANYQGIVWEWLKKSSNNGVKEWYS